MSAHYRPPLRCHVCTVLLNAVNRKPSGSRGTSWCRTCFENRPHLCLACGETDPAKFGAGKRTRCKACRNRFDRTGLPNPALDFIDSLPRCRVCGMRDSHVSEGLCVLCEREAGRPKANRTPWRVEEAA